MKRLTLLLILVMVSIGCERNRAKQSRDDGGSTDAGESAHPKLPSVGTVTKPISTSKEVRQEQVDPVKVFLEKNKSSLGDYELLKRLIEEHLATLSSDRERAHFTNLLIRAMPAEQYECQWQLCGDYIKNPEQLNGFLAMALRNAMPINPAWVIKQINSSSDPSLCDLGIQGMVNYYWHNTSPLDCYQQLKSSFQDHELFDLGVGYWLDNIDLYANKRDLFSAYEEMLRDQNLGTKTRDRIASEFMKLPSNLSALDRATQLADLGITDGGWNLLIGAGAKLRGDDSNGFIEQVYRASRYVQVDFIQAYIRENDAPTLIQELGDKPGAARSDILLDLSGTIFKNSLVSATAAKLGSFDPVEQSRLADVLVRCAAQQGISSDRVAELIDLGNERQRRLDLYEASKPGQPKL
ncbi:MAG: hypothetical protein WCK77_20965 [Verrucomicrobiota bacterium]